ncbi:hypothetical protein ACFPRL_23390 [Pseudoclavibacter helvolus]
MREGSCRWLLTGSWRRTSSSAFRLLSSARRRFGERRRARGHAGEAGPAFSSAARYLASAFSSCRRVCRACAGAGLLCEGVRDPVGVDG